MGACGDCLRKVKDVVRYRSKPVRGTAGAVAVGIIGLAGQAMTACRQGELAGVSVLTAGDAHLQEVTHGIIIIICRSDMLRYTYDNLLDNTQANLVPLENTHNKQY